MLAQLVLAVVVLFLIRVLLLFLKWRSTMNVMSNVPGPAFSFPFQEDIRLFWHVLKDGFKNEGNVVSFKLRVQLAKEFAKYGIFRTSIGFIPIVTLLRQDTVEPLLNSNTLLTKGPTYKFLQPWLGQGLLLSTGSKWRTRRKMLTHAFHFRILEDFLPIMNEQAQILAKKLKESSDKPFVDTVPMVCNCTLDIICETAMGIKVNAQSNTKSEYVQAVNDFSTSAVQRILRPYLWRDFIFKWSSIGRRYYKSLDIMHSFTRKVIQQRKEEFLAKQQNPTEQTTEDELLTGKQRKAFLDLLLTQHFSDDSFTEEDIREEVDTFMFEGHDTTAMGVSWSLYLLGLHPEIQKKLHEELDEIFGDDRTRHATSDDLREMKYLECVIKESQRLYPSVPGVARTLTEDLQINDYKIPKGTMVNVSIYTIHRDENNYPNPDVFDPDRFTFENTTGRNPYAYIPFSAGPRNCIGQKFAMNEEKILLSTVLRNFHITSLDKRDDSQVVAELVLRPRRVIRIKFTPRN